MHQLVWSPGYNKAPDDGGKLACFPLSLLGMKTITQSPTLNLGGYLFLSYCNFCFPWALLMFFLAVLRHQLWDWNDSHWDLPGMESGVEKWQTLLHLYHTQDKREPLQWNPEVWHDKQTSAAVSADPNQGQICGHDLQALNAGFYSSSWPTDLSEGGKLLRWSSLSPESYISFDNTFGSRQQLVRHPMLAYHIIN